MSSLHSGSWPTAAELGHGFGHRLQAIREEQQLTTTELARRLGVSKSSISKYESGRHIPTAMILARLALRLQVSTDYLLGLTAATAAPGAWVDAELEQLFRELDRLLDDESRACLLPLIRALVSWQRLLVDRFAGTEAPR
jgi:transcriptional regulator with XRE-family HTH domain